MSIRIDSYRALAGEEVSIIRLCVDAIRSRYNFDPDCSVDIMAKRGANAWSGSFTPSKKKIEVRTGSAITKWQFALVLLHELVHAAEQTAGVRYDYDARYRNRRAEIAADQVAWDILIGMVRSGVL